MTKEIVETDRFWLGYGPGHIFIGVDPGTDDKTADAVMSIQKVGWHWVKLPPPTLRQRLVAWWRGVEIPTEALQEKYAFALNPNVLIDGIVSAGIIHATEPAP